MPVPGSRGAWKALSGLLAAGGLLFSAVALAEEEPEWPKGHFPLPEAGNVIGEVYRVEAGEEDTLLDIAREHNVGYEEIRSANPDVSVWVPGEGTEVVIPSKFILPDAERTGIVINIAELRLYYYPEVGEGETPRVETYPIGIGREGYDTPLGVTKTTMRLEDPAWYPPRSMREEAAERGESAPPVVPPGPDNPLGRHAILLDIPGYLIHGTNEPDGIGMRASRGCIRMFPEDIESVFHSVPVGTQVNIIDQPIKVGWDEGQPLVQVFEPLEEQEHGMSALVETLGMLNQGNSNGVAFDYEQLRELLDHPNGQVVALEPPPKPEPEPKEPIDEGEGLGLLDELTV
ncbi:L,D-transpeptidase family protein [Halomonas campisalis]|uniref:L,D-transpeptidase family protein n=2 Tax=Billgrantia campisalis TaxID=74661 RepID=A0ABS9P6P4_9GAMM|nr:L,D-transpeptidase family protein [Halomonas campisalis]